MSCSNSETVVLDNGRSVGRIRYGAAEEGGGWGAEEGRKCHDCGAEPGALHDPGCDVERCPRCCGQLFICGCLHPNEMTRFGWKSHEDFLQTLGALIIRERNRISRIDEMAGASSAHDGDVQATPAEQRQMKFGGTCKALRDSLAPVIAVATRRRRGDGEHLGRISLRVVGKAIRAWADNGHTAIRKIVYAVLLGETEYPWSEESPTVTVEAKLLHDYLRSFAPAEMLCIELQADGKELVMHKQADPNVVRHLPCYDAPVSEITPPESFGQEVQIRRDAFLRGVSKVLFAAGKDKTNPHFMNWAFRIAADKARFCAGTGGRFAWIELFGSGLLKARSRNQTYLIPAQQTIFLTTVLAASKDSHIFLGSSTTRDVLLMRTTDTEVIVKLDPSLGWPDERKVVFRQPQLRVVTPTKDWALETKGIMATYGEQCRGRHLHIATVTADGTAKKLAMVVRCHLSSSRYVDIVDYRATASKVSLVTIADNLADVAKAIEDDGYIQIHVNAVGETTTRAIVAWYNAGATIRSRNALTHINKHGWTESFCLFFREYSEPSKSAPSGQQTSDQSAKKEVQ